VKIRESGYRSTRTWLVFLGTLVASGGLLAQDLPEITVTSTRMGLAAVTKKVTGRAPATGAPIEHLTLTWSVAYSDLDLSQPGAVVVLEKRIHSRAEAVCHELDRLFPLSPSGGASCAKTASDAAMLQARKIIASAEKPQPSPDTR
jgi:UrcA family protein